MTSGTIARRFASLSAEIGSAADRDDITHAAKRCVIDWFAATVPGCVRKQATAIEAGLGDELGFGPSRTISGKRAPMRTAALINGLASHIVEFDDIYAPAIYHPGSPVIAAALSAATGLNLSGPDFLRSVVVGYEVSTRIGVAMGKAHYKHWHNTGTIGTIGAAAAVGGAYDLRETEMAHALATATTMAAGLKGAFRGVSEIKPLHAGHAADAGFVAAGLARNGVVAAGDMFEGPAGFAAAMSNGVDWEDAIGRPAAYNIQRMTVKNHGCCGHIFAALDGVMALRRAHGFAVADVAAIRIGGYSATVDVTGNQSAETAADAKFCLPFIVASGLVHGAIRLNAYTEARLRDPVVRSLMPRIAVHLDPEIDALFPDQRAANVTVVLGTGEELSRFQPHRIGDPDLPLSDLRLDEKFIELTSEVVPKHDAKRLLEVLWSLETLPGLDPVYACLGHVGVVGGRCQTDR